MTMRPTHGILIAAAVVIAFGGGAVAGSQITSAQIKDNTVASRDIKNKTISGKDIKNRTITTAKLAAAACAPGELSVSGMCAATTHTGQAGLFMAYQVCSDRGGRLPTFAEFEQLYAMPGFVWAGGNVSLYEWLQDFHDTGTGLKPTARDAAGNLLQPGLASTRHYHCLVPKS